jgi:hypothetical protein
MGKAHEMQGYRCNKVPPKLHRLEKIS